MKTRFLLFPKNYFLFLIILLSMVAGFSNIVMGQFAGDFRSSGAGNWNDYTKWERYDGAIWSAAIAGQTPASSNSVYIQIGHTITLTQNEACLDLNINNGAATVIAIATFTLEVNEKLRSYSGVVNTLPGTSSSTVGGSCISSTAGVGRIKFVGSTRTITATGEWGNNPQGWDVEFAPSPGNIFSLQTGFKARNIVISSGTVTSSSADFRPDGFAGGTGTLTVKTGSILQFSGSSINIKRVGTAGATSHFGTFTVESGAILDFSGTGSPTIGAASIIFNGTVQYSGGGAQALATKGGNTGGSDPSMYTNLRLGGTSAKTLGLNTTVIGTLTIAGSANEKHPNNSSTTDYLNRYWDVTSANISSFSCDVTGTYVPGDVAGSESNQAAGKYNGTLPWVKYSMLGSNTLTANGVTGFSSFTGITAASPTVVITGSPSLTVCKNTPMTLTAQAIGDQPFTYLWSPGNETTPAINPSTVVPGITNYAVTVTDGNGFTAIATSTITVGEDVILSSVTATPSNVCYNGSTTLTASLIVAGTPAYCAANSTSGASELISNLTLNGINNTSASTAGYEDFTIVSTALAAGTAYPVSISVFNAYANDDHVYIWVDLDQNGIFSNPGEKVYDAAVSTFCPLCSGSSTAVLTGTVTVPATSFNGLTRMRIRLQDNLNGPNTTPCGSSDYGQVEDYTVNITGAIAPFTYSWSENPASGSLTSTTANPTTATGLTTQETYSVTVTSVSGCSATGSVIVPVYPMITVYNVTGGGSFCAGETGVYITLSGTETGINYELWRNGIPTGTILAGNCCVFTFTGVNVPGNYTVIATNPITGCSVLMNGSVAVTENPLPDNTLAVAGSTAICFGTGTTITVALSVPGSTYQLRNDDDNSLVGLPVTGNGGTIILPTGPLTATTTFNVLASITATGCSAQLHAKAIVTVNPIPDISLAVSATLEYICSGTGTNVSVASSVLGTSYQLRNDADNSPIGSPVDGDGGTIILPTGLLTSTTTFNVLATITSTGCSAQLTGKVTTVILEAGPVITIPNANFCPEAATIDVPVTVSSIASIGSFSLTFGFTPAELRAPRIISRNPAFDLLNHEWPGFDSTTNLTMLANGIYKVSGLGINPDDAITLGANDILFTLRFNIVSGTTSSWVTFIENTQGTACEFTGAGYDYTPYCDNPTFDYYFPGMVMMNPAGQVNQPGNQVVCNGGSTATVTFTTVNNDGITSYAWTNSTTAIGLPGAGAGNINSFTAINTTNAPIVATITVTPTFTMGTASCVGEVKTFTITVNPTGQVNQPASQVVCHGTSTSVFFNTTNTGGTVTYSWTNSNTTIGLTLSNGTGNISAFTAVNTGTSYAVALITVTPAYTNGEVSCEGPSKSFTITVNPLGQVNNIASQEVCHNTSTSAVVFSTINTGGNTTYLWTNDTPGIGLASGGTGIIPAFNAINMGLVPVVAIITVIPYYEKKAVSCPGTSISFTITVDPVTAGGTVASNQMICSGTQPADLFLSGNTGIVVKWQKSSDVLFNAPIDIPVTSTTLSGTTIGNLTANTYFRAVLQSGVCNSAYSSSILVTVIPNPTLSGATQLAIVCAGSPAMIQLTGLLPGSTSTVTYTIAGIVQSPVAGVVASGSGAGSFLTPILTALNNGQTLQITGITVTSATPNCGGTFAQNVILSVSSASQGGTVAPNQTICAGTQPANLYLSDNNGTVLNWQRSSNVAFNSPTDIAVTSTTLTGATIGNLFVNTYFRAVVQSGACGSEYSGFVLITVNPTPILVTHPQAVCTPNRVNLTLPAVTAGSTLPANTILPFTYWIDANATIPVPNPTSVFTGTFYIKAITTDGCYDIKPIAATVNPLPTVFAGTGSGCYCANEPGLVVGLAGSQIGVEYSLWIGLTMVHVPVAGTGSAISFGLQSLSGTYWVLAQNTTTQCINRMYDCIYICITQPLPVSVSIVASANPVAAGTSVTFTATPVNGGSTPGYQWQINGFNAGTNSATFTYKPFDGDEVTCILTSSEECVSGTGTSAPVIMDVTGIAPVTSVTGGVGNGMERCYSATQTLTVAGAGTTFTVYPGGIANMVAGISIFYLPGTKVLAGGYMHGRISNQYCGLKAPSIVATSVGENEIVLLSQNASFKIYPNPTAGNFILEQTSSSLNEKVSIQIYGMHGEKVLTGEMNHEMKHEFSIFGFPAGLYFVKVIAGENTETFKLIKTR